jgi:hypothetical protein
MIWPKKGNDNSRKCQQKYYIAQQIVISTCPGYHPGWNLLAHHIISRDE